MRNTTEIYGNWVSLFEIVSTLGVPPTLFRTLLTKMLYVLSR